MIGSCTYETDETQKLEFKTTTPSRMQFNNTRSIFYHKSGFGDGKIDRFFFKKFDDKKWPFYPVIYNDWYREQAMLRLEAEGGVPLAPGYQVQLETGEQVILGGLEMTQQFDFANKIYLELMNEKEVKISNQKILFSGEPKPYLQVLLDYRRLVEVE